MRGAEGRSGEAIPFRVVPARGQAPDHLSEEFSVVEAKEVCHVLHEHVSGSKLANDSVHFAPKDSLGMAETLALAGA